LVTDMAKYVLVSDPTLSRDYHGFALLDFVTRAPTRFVPTWLYEFLARGRSQPQSRHLELLVS